MNDKVLEKRCDILGLKPLSEMTFLESLTIKSINYIIYKEEQKDDNINKLIKLLIEVEEEETRIKEMWIYDYVVRKSELLDLYINFDKKLNAAIEEVLNAKD
ncbi:hypothetical protein UFOVP733_31 [uncultured Caudovirales phage]|uniref:Uncharacterized protein n=1 Tax=uncultured Caudovirales phage TaxID=2100421 RepID=A0A6J5NMW3_9CAUD|nr:hypothetical protein UFOVP733_31 [uncultured Caudovirales phage]CAB5224895.1 hypothetical protein UFOVP743_28 [uncultured Caudovirales phage]